MLVISPFSATTRAFHYFLLVSAIDRSAPAPLSTMCHQSFSHLGDIQTWIFFGVPAAEARTKDILVLSCGAASYLTQPRTTTTHHTPPILTHPSSLSILLQSPCRSRRHSTSRFGSRRTRICSVRLSETSVCTLGKTISSWPSEDQTSAMIIISMRRRCANA